jgi:hypothetical protein
MNHGARNAALKRLDAFIGEWRIDASFPGAPPGRSVFEWMLDGQYLLQRTEAPDPAPDSLTIVSVDLQGAYTQHYFDSRGVTRLYAMTFTRGTWTLRRQTPDFSPLDFHQRFIGRFSKDGKVIKGAWEASEDEGSSWRLDFELTFTKLTDRRKRRK